MEFNMPKKSYFAAANGFGGFRSYFETVFNPKEFLRLFVIKGGPGTGKSSLMKKIAAHFESKGYEIEAIFCSSDKNSLDGIIINSKKGKVGILDGTAPHQTDAKIPGAIDEIINLGELWNHKLLIDNRETIIKLNDKKKSHYKSAYEYLRIAGEFFYELNRYISEAYQKSDSQLINDLIFDIPHLNASRNTATRLFSAFGKDGYTRLPITETLAKKKLSVTGTYGSEYIFMNHLLNAIESKGVPYIKFTSPFSDGLTEGVLFPETETFIVTGSDFNEKTDTSIFLEESVLKNNKEKLNYYSKEFDEILTRAKDEFSAASESHFELEKIYTAAMNFTKIDALRENLIIYIADIIS